MKSARYLQPKSRFIGAEVPMLRQLSSTMLSACLTLALTRPCFAQGRPARKDAAAAPTPYKALVDAAIQEFDAGNYAEAHENFARAHALSPNARTLRGIGMSQFELRQYVDAVSSLEGALAFQEKPLEGALRKETEALLARARSYVGELRLVLAPEDAELRVDGFLVQVDPGQSLRLPVGEHVLEVSASGYLTERRALKLRGEQVIDLTLSLTAPAPVAAAAPAPDRTGARADQSPSAEHTPVYKRWWLWTLVGVGLAGGVTAAVLLTRKTEQEEHPVTTDNTPPDGAFQPLWSF